MNRLLQTTLAVAALAACGQAAAQVTFYEGEGFRGRAFTTSRQIGDFARSGFNDRASSVVVDQGRWEVCEDARFDGRCVVLRKGSYDSLRSLGLENRISSVRPVDRRRAQGRDAPEPMAAANYNWRRRANEPVYNAQVTSVRAVMGPPTERCWVERQVVSDQRGERNTAGAIAGALLGGVLGHQVGGGSGKDIATVGGAVAGGVIGSNIGRDGAYTNSRDMRRCQTTASTEPAYWDVSYSYEGREHHVQMSEAPGRTIAVNRAGEPRQ
ncbi:MAG: glycine zipper 2TM domain-containing protein [Burkholderiales bacterium]|nr:glycine zipper 2TM domain-containing protein [Burkholderiales bacterium]